MGRREPKDPGALMRRRDFPTFPRFSSPEWSASQITSLDRFLRALRDYLERPDWRAVEFDFAGGSTPTKDVGASVMPFGALPLGLWSVGAAGLSSVAAPLPFQWDFADGTLSIPSLAGLAAGTYRIRVLIWEAR